MTQMFFCVPALLRLTDVKNIMSSKNVTPKVVNIECEDDFKRIIDIRHRMRTDGTRDTDVERCHRVRLNGGDLKPTVFDTEAWSENAKNIKRQLRAHGSGVCQIEELHWPALSVAFWEDLGNHFLHEFGVLSLDLSFTTLCSLDGASKAISPDFPACTLTKLCLFNCVLLPNDFLQHVSTLANLRELNIGATIPNSLQPLQHLRKLTHLVAPRVVSKILNDIGDSDGDQKVLEGLQHMCSLRSLDLSRNIYEYFKMLGQLENMIRLESLNLNRCNGLDLLSTLANGERNRAVLLTLKNLRHLDMTECLVSRRPVRDAVNGLQLSAKEFEDYLHKMVSNMPHLQELKLGMNDDISELNSSCTGRSKNCSMDSNMVDFHQPMDPYDFVLGDVTVMDSVNWLTGFAPCTQLKSLSLWDTCNFDSLGVLVRFPLQSLEIGTHPVCGDQTLRVADWELLSSFEYLRHLKIRNSKITSLAPLLLLRNLEFLDIRDCAMIPIQDFGEAFRNSTQHSFQTLKILLADRTELTHGRSAEWVDQAKEVLFELIVIRGFQGIRQLHISRPIHGRVGPKCFGSLKRKSKTNRIISSVSDMSIPELLDRCEECRQVQREFGIHRAPFGTSRPVLNWREKMM